MEKNIVILVLVFLLKIFMFSKSGVYTRSHVLYNFIVKFGNTKKEHNLQLKEQSITCCMLVLLPFFFLEFATSSLLWSLLMKKEEIQKNYFKILAIVVIFLVLMIFCFNFNIFFELVDRFCLYFLFFFFKWASYYPLTKFLVS